MVITMGTAGDGVVLRTAADFVEVGVMDIDLTVLAVDLEGLIVSRVVFVCHND